MKVLAVAAGMNPMDLKRGIDKAVSAAVEAVQGMSTPCEDNTAIAQVGTISANSDSSVGEIIAEAMKGQAEGVIVIEEGSVSRTNWTWLRACSSTVVTCHPTSSTTRTTCRRK